MSDPADRQTKPLPLDEQPAKPRRGRPATGKALSNAERQRLYRERQKAQRNEKPETGLRGALALWEEACRNLGRANERIRELEAELATLRGDLKIANAKLAQRNGNKETTWTLQGRTGSGKWENLAAGLTEKEASRQMDRLIDAKLAGNSRRQYRLVEEI